MLINNTKNKKSLENDKKKILNLKSQSTYRHNNHTFRSRRRPIMIDLVMIPQIPLLPEAQTAIDATERLLVGMYQPVSLQLVLDPEAPPAHVARIRLLPRVSRNVNHQRRLRPKALIAVAAPERKRVGVRAIVHEQRRLLLERLPAQVADVRTFVRVDASVLDDVPAGREHPPAQVAREVLDALVRLAQVAHEALRDAELLAAQVADERTFAGVDAHVPDVGVGGVQALAAELAVVVDAAVDDDLGRVDGGLVDLGALAAVGLFRVARGRFGGVCRWGPGKNF